MCYISASILNFNLITALHTYYRLQNWRALTDFDIGVNGIPYNLIRMYTTFNQSFKCYVALAWWWSKWPRLVATNRI